MSVKQVTKKRKMSYRNDESDDESEKDSDVLVEAIDNHIYLYSDITQKSVFELIKHIRYLNVSLLNDKNRLNLDNCYIYLHINSMGGDVFAALSAVDTILQSKIPIVSVVEGCAASSATIISVVAQKRQIMPHASMLIHQLSSGFWGKYLEIKDEMKNLTYLEDLTKDLYKKYSNGKLTDGKLKRFLKHDIWWSAEKSKKYGLVDEII